MSSGSAYLFMIVTKNDNPIYEVEFMPNPKKENGHLSQFILHASLDVIEEIVWKNNSTYLKVVDKYNEPLISALVTAGHTKFLLLHDNKNEDGIKSFFYEVYELYVKILMNPFYNVTSPISSHTFDSKVKQLARKYL
eukprot:TRINITY_DN2415_c0_g2_i1.p1 TRINITY_DN2415_c0_g2~~TRINITY_DN2415_c0_g2_i1.p1  ORF type:complete len:147 (+),score=37.19 TRINITY_DN2415_c0_g2_i1:31-441(+)